MSYNLSVICQILPGKLLTHANIVIGHTQKSVKFEFSKLKYLKRSIRPNAVICSNTRGRNLSSYTFKENWVDHLKG